MELSAALNQLKQTTFAIHPLNDIVWEEFAGIWQPFSARRKTVLTTVGETEKHLYFVTKGVQRAFTMTANDREATIVFTYPYSFSGILDSFLLQTPSKYYLETLTQSHFLTTTYQQVEVLMARHHQFETMIRKSLSITISGLLERQTELQCYSAEQKFTTLLNRSPHILHLIPHKYLASYLGLDATTFSKLLATVRL